MNIIKSSYNKNTIEEFKKQELEKIGESNYKFVRKIEKFVNILFYILIGLILLSLVTPSLIFKNKPLIAFIISLSLILVFGICAWIVMGRNENGLFNITVKVMKKKQILFSPILNESFDFLYENHKTLIKIYEFIENNKTASFMPYNYNGYNGWIKISYNDGTYIKFKEFHIDESLIKYILKEDKVDCSYLDKYLQKYIENKLNKNTKF